MPQFNFWIPDDLYAELRAVASAMALPGRGGSVAVLLRKAAAAFIDPDRSSPDLIAVEAARRTMEQAAENMEAVAEQLHRISAYLRRPPARIPVAPAGQSVGSHPLDLPPDLVSRKTPVEEMTISNPQAAASSPDGGVEATGSGEATSISPGLGQRIRDLCKSKGLTQKALAQRVGKSRSVIADYERGYRRPPFDVLLKLADIFSVTVDYLLGRSDQCT